MRGKSDAQLDAEADWTCWICDPRRNGTHGRNDLEARLRCHRWAYRVDCHVPRLVARQPPTLMDFEIMDYRTEDGSGVGMPMSGPFIRRLESPGAMYPWTSGFFALRADCRKYHYDHRRADRPFWRGRLCWEAVRLTVIGGERAIHGPMTPEQAAGMLRLDRITELLLGAFDDVETGMKRAEERAEKRAREDEGRGDGAIPVERPAHHAVPGLHAAECPQCRRNAA